MTLEETEQRLIEHIEASAQARVVLSQLRGMELTALDVQRALCSVLSIDVANPNLLLERGLKSSEIVGLLRAFDFKVFHPEVLAEIELVEGLLPAEIVSLLTEKTVKVKGEVWRVHKNDADPFPSVPHAHNYDAGVTLHLGTGELFNAQRQSIGKIGDKRLRALREKLAGIELPPL